MNGGGSKEDLENTTGAIDCPEKIITAKSFATQCLEDVAKQCVYDQIEISNERFISIKRRNGVSVAVMVDSVAFVRAQRFQRRIIPKVHFPSIFQIGNGKGSKWYFVVSFETYFMFSVWLCSICYISGAAAPLENNGQVIFSGGFIPCVLAFFVFGPLAFRNLYQTVFGKSDPHVNPHAIASSNRDGLKYKAQLFCCVLFIVAYAAMIPAFLSSAHAVYKLHPPPKYHVQSTAVEKRVCTATDDAIQRALCKDPKKNKVCIQPGEEKHTATPAPVTHMHISNPLLPETCQPEVKQSVFSSWVSALIASILLAVVAVKWICEAVMVFFKSTVTYFQSVQYVSLMKLHFLGPRKLGFPQAITLPLQDGENMLELFISTRSKHDFAPLYAK